MTGMVDSYDNFSTFLKNIYFCSRCKKPPHIKLSSKQEKNYFLSPSRVISSLHPSLSPRKGLFDKDWKMASYFEINKHG